MEEAEPNNQRSSDNSMDEIAIPDVIDFGGVKWKRTESAIGQTYW